jgi:hypothetical protein
MPDSFTCDQLIEALKSAFPQRVVQGVITPHDCEECSALRLRLAGRSWNEIPNEVVEEFADGLPLLSPDAYNAYLPVWLRSAIENPDGDAAGMVPINLSSQQSKEGFTPAQARVLIAVVEFIANHCIFGAGDPVNIEKIAQVKATWSEDAA